MNAPDKAETPKPEDVALWFYSRGRAPLSGLAGTPEALVRSARALASSAAESLVSAGAGDMNAIVVEEDIEARLALVCAAKEQLAKAFWRTHDLERQIRGEEARLAQLEIDRAKVRAENERLALEKLEKGEE